MTMKNSKQVIWFYISFFWLLLLSCEGYECNHGVVIDSNTRKPIDSVLCVSNGGDKVYTNSYGRYEDVCSPFGGCMPKCSELEIEFSKDGYKNLKEKSKFDTIRLEKKTQ